MFGDKRPLSARMRRTERAHQRERLAFRYIGALERGNFETIAAILGAAEGDPELERLLREIDAAYTAELDHTTSPQERKNMIAMNDKRTVKTERGAGLRLTPVWFAAAAALIFAFAAVWMSGRGLLPGGNVPSGNNGSSNNIGAPMGANTQDATATPIPTSTPTVANPDTWVVIEGTLVPFTQFGDITMAQPGSFTIIEQGGTLVPFTQFGDITMAQPGTYIIDSSLSGLCVQSRAVLDVRSRPAADAALVTALQPETEFRVQSHILDEAQGLWLNIGVTIETASIQGWISADNDFRFVLCADAFVTFGAVQMGVPGTIVQPEMIVVPTVVPLEPNVDMFALTATAIIAEATLLAGTANSTGLDSVFQTATALIAEATAMAATATPAGG